MRFPAPYGWFVHKKSIHGSAEKQWLQLHYIKLFEIGAIFSLFLTLKPDFGWGKCLGLPHNDWELVDLPPGEFLTSLGWNWWQWLSVRGSVA